MQRTHAYARLTHKYVGTHKHLDRHRYVGSVNLTPPQVVERPGPDADFSEGNRYVQFARLPAGLSAKQRRELASAIEDENTSHGCSHEYDCCGCASYHARAQVRGRRLYLRVAVSFNY